MNPLNAKEWKKIKLECTLGLMRQYRKQKWDNVLLATEETVTKSYDQIFDKALGELRKLYPNKEEYLYHLNLVENDYYEKEIHPLKPPKRGEYILDENNSIIFKERE